MSIFEKHKQDFQASFDQTEEIAQLEELRIKFLGKTGILSSLFADFKSIPNQEKKAYGAAVNELKEYITQQINEAKQSLEEKWQLEKISKEKVDITLPPRNVGYRGKKHPITAAIERLTSIAEDMGMLLVSAPEMEKDWYNFGALNVPELHPARQMQDTFYIEAANDEAPSLLRTHTSNAQIHHMLGHEPPCRIFSVGRVYRCDSDATHTPMFHQMEILVIDEDVKLQHLKWCIETLLARFFELDAAPIRFRPSYFPFVEPGLEVDVRCDRSDPGNIKIGQGSDWLEILGCGMVHPNVLDNCKVDKTRYRGFALGLGVERLAMLKYGIHDLRDMFEGDMKWEKHFGL
jgi:phenylalanyl-tRNA synthetase alpha chain